jgi:hypothetical protein
MWHPDLAEESICLAHWSMIHRCRKLSVGSPMLPGRDSVPNKAVMITEHRLTAHTVSTPSPSEDAPKPFPECLSNYLSLPQAGPPITPHPVQAAVASLSYQPFPVVWSAQVLVTLP